MAANLNKIIDTVSCGPGMSNNGSLFQWVEKKICFNIKPLFTPNVSILNFHLNICFYENTYIDPIDFSHSSVLQQ